LTVRPAKTATRHGGDQGDEREDAREPEVQREPAERAAGSDHPGDRAEDEGRDDEDIDKVGEQDEPQRQADAPLSRGPSTRKVSEGEDRPEDDKPQRRDVLDTAHDASAGADAPM
jgi:hypothetical protein